MPNAIKPQNDLRNIPGTSVKDLDEPYTEDFLRQVRLSSARLRHDSDQEILHKRNVLTAAQNDLTLAGLCALGDYPQQFLFWGKYYRRSVYERYSP